MVYIYIERERERERKRIPDSFSLLGILRLSNIFFLSSSNSFLRASAVWPKSFQQYELGG